MELTNITFDARDPGRLAAFWAAVTGRQVGRGPPLVRGRWRRGRPA